MCENLEPQKIKFRSRRAISAISANSPFIFTQQHLVQISTRNCIPTKRNASRPNTLVVLKYKNQQVTVYSYTGFLLCKASGGDRTELPVPLLNLWTVA